jgi:hypothetical protein
VVKVAESIISQAVRFEIILTVAYKLFLLSSVSLFSLNIITISTVSCSVVLLNLQIAQFLH